MTNDELAAIAARAWGIVRASTTPEIGVVAVHALQARIEGALREQATAAAERERVLREALLNLCSAVDVRLMAETEYQNAVGLGRPYSVRSRLGDKAAEAITAEMVALSAAKRAALEATS